MTDDDRFLEPDPFQEPLAPLPLQESGKSAKARKPKAVTAEVPSDENSESGQAQTSVLGRVERVEESSGSGTATVSRWKFWKRPNKNDEQLEALRQGATEMVGLMRSIRDHLEGEHRDRDGLIRSLSPLPSAVESLQSMSDRQDETGRTLEGLRTTLEQRAKGDGLVLRSLDRMGNTMSHVEETFGQLDRTLAGMDESNQHTARNMELLGERVADSGRFMNESFVQLLEAERDFTDFISRSSRRSGLGMAAVCSLLAMSVVAVGFMFRENRNLLTAVQQNGALVVQVPQNTAPYESPQSLALFDEQLKQVDDGIEEPDREMVTKPRDPKAEGVKEVVPVDTDGSGLLSINKALRRK
ncbi:MAG: hypothetical protein MK194_15125 [Roseibacillus sp.]|nr:hypothetical protein [Roseibacillus sp.]